MEKGYHSGLGSGVVADTFWILLDLMDQLENVKNGDVTVPGIVVNVPKK